MKKLLSYILTLTDERNSEYNGTLEIKWVNGKKILDSKNANYSYGSLLKILETGIAATNLENVNHVLLLGLGGGSIIKSLRNKFNYHNNILAVEIDPVIISIAKTEFEITNSENLIIENTDAFEFVSSCESKYDLIIVDLFIDNIVPPRFYSELFCRNLSRILNNDGSVIFNLGIYVTEDSLIEQTCDFFKNQLKFQCDVLKKVNKTNTLLIAKKLMQTKH